MARGTTLDPAWDAALDALDQIPARAATSSNPVPRKGAPTKKAAAKTTPTSGTGSPASSSKASATTKKPAAHKSAPAKKAAARKPAAKKSTTTRSTSRSTRSVGGITMPTPSPKKLITAADLLAPTGTEVRGFELQVAEFRIALDEARNTGKKVPVARIPKEYHSRLTDFADVIIGDLDATPPAAGTIIGATTAVAADPAVVAHRASSPNGLYFIDTHTDGVVVIRKSDNHTSMKITLEEWNTGKAKIGNLDKLCEAIATKGVVPTKKTLKDHFSFNK